MILCGFVTFVFIHVRDMLIISVIDITIAITTNIRVRVQHVLVGDHDYRSWVVHFQHRGNAPLWAGDVKVPFGRGDNKDRAEISRDRPSLMDNETGGLVLRDRPTHEGVVRLFRVY